MKPYLYLKKKKERKREGGREEGKKEGKKRKDALECPDLVVHFVISVRS